MGLGEEDVSDIFQETFLRLHQNLYQIENPEKIGPWLAKTASNLCLTTLRTQRRRRLADIEEALEDLAIPDGPDSEELITDALEADTARYALEQISARCRDLLTQLFIEEADYREISESLGIPVGAIGPTRQRCLAKLRELLQKQGFFDGDVS